VLGRAKGWLNIEHAGQTGYILENDRYVRLTTIDESAGSSLDADQRVAAEKREAWQREADDLQHKLTASRKQLDAVSRKEQAVIDEINASAQALDRHRREVRATRHALEQLETRTEEIERDYAALDARIAAGREYAAQRLRALYKLNWIGRVQLLATAHSFYDFVQRKASLERILSQDEAVLERLRADQNALEQLLEQVNAKRAEQKALRIDLNRRIAVLNTEQERRTALLGNIRNQKELEQAAFKALRQAALELDSTMASFEPPQGADTARPAPDRPGIHQRFDQYKGLLSWPVKGKIISFFGPYRDEKANLVNFQSGINISAERGEPIRAVSGGYVIFSSWFKGFGNMLIIDHGHHYYTVYAHLEEVFKVKGDRIDKDEVIATVGDSGSLIGPVLHFEIRHHGKPIDPLEWINKG
jgi:septal ring factor EnvC (AmiA/AmiB activator)